MSKVEAILAVTMVLAVLTAGLSDGHEHGNGKGIGLGNGKGQGHGPGNGNGHGPGEGNGNNAGLKVGFYRGKCKRFDVEEVVAGVVQEWFEKDMTITAALLRMQFHDCFVKGCDASILLDGTTSEKASPPNRSVRGFDLIEAVKAKLESFCAGVVSCADIIAIVTRDAVELGKGGRYKVETGRRDGTESLAKNVILPSASISVSDSIKVFDDKGISTTDMVYLLGAHTVGITHCSLIKNRLYNFNKTGGSDPNMDSGLLKALKIRCPQNATTNNVVDLDQNPLSANTVDNSFFRQIVKKRGILQIDQDLALDTLTKQSVESIASGFDFLNKFGEAMVKMGRIQVLTGNQGEIRRFCNVTNS